MSIHECGGAFGGDGDDLELDRGDGCTTLSVYSIPTTEMYT